MWPGDEAIASVNYPGLFNLLVISYRVQRIIILEFVFEIELPPSNCLTRTLP